MHTSSAKVTQYAPEDNEYKLKIEEDQERILGVRLYFGFPLTSQLSEMSANEIPSITKRRGVIR